MIFEQPNLAEVSYVMERLRPSSRAEIFATARIEDPLAIAGAFVSAGGYSWAVYYDGRPAAIIGGYEMHPGVWALYGFGTDAYEYVIRETTKVGRRRMMPKIAGAGAHRAECMSLASLADNHRWLEMLGARREATLRGYGKHGEDFHLYAWLKEDADVRQQEAA